jgi:hypothetical protein
MDEDMVRLKSLLEEGKTRVDGQPVELDELTPHNAGSTSSTPKRRQRR